MRRIDWASTARSGELQSRVVLEDVTLTLAVILDASRSMRVGRRRPLLAAGREALDDWFGAASSDDRCIRVDGANITPAALQRGSRRAVAHRDAGDAFDLGRTLRTARAALPRGTALLSDLGLVRPRRAVRSRARRSRLALRLHGARRARSLVRRAPTGGHRSSARRRGWRSCAAYIGKRERAAYHAAVRAREAALLARFETANWRSGVLREENGRGSLLAAFGLRS